MFNNFLRYPAAAMEVLARLYKSRWQVERFCTGNSSSIGSKTQCSTTATSENGGHDCSGP